MMTLKVKDMRCDVVIGVYQQEKTRTQRLVVNLAIDFDEGKAPQTDNIDDTLNYHPLIDEVREYVEKSNFHLLEALNEGIGRIVLKHPRVTGCNVEIDKPEAPIKGIESLSISKYYKK